MSNHFDRSAARSLGVQGPHQAGPPDLLASATADVIDVALCVRHANWHRRGVDFLEHYDVLEEVGDALDKVARILRRHAASLHERSPGAEPVFATESSFKPYPVAITGSQDHIEAVLLRLGLVSAQLRGAVHVTLQHGARATAAVLAQASCRVDEAMALLERHIAGGAPLPDLRSEPVLRRPLEFPTAAAAPSSRRPGASVLAGSAGSKGQVPNRPASKKPLKRRSDHHVLA